MERVGKENNGRRSTAPIDGGVAGTPLSTSSAYRNAGERFEEDDSPFPKVDGPGDSGIMNFIFRGKPTVRPNKQRGNASMVHLPQVPDQMRNTDAPPTERDQVELEVIKSLMDSYFKIVRKNFIDLVPKTIMYYLVNHVRDAVQNELVSELYRDAEVGNLMQEAEDIAQRRQTCEEMSDLLNKAMEIVNEVRDFNTFK
jgi:dynamin 1-like protein